MHIGCNDPAVDKLRTGWDVYYFSEVLRLKEKLPSAPGAMVKPMMISMEV